MDGEPGERGDSKDVAAPAAVAAPVAVAASAETIELKAFRDRLAELSPRVVVTPALLGINIVVAGLMVAFGVHPLSPSLDSLIAWGANFGPLSTGGQWWRLATSMFLHGGLLHLLMNMWVLWDAGRMIERLVGARAYATAYLLAGLCGSIASALWNKHIVSVGASGAIFGLFGVLGAFLLRHRGSLPPAALRPLTRSTLFFVGYNVIFGFTQERIDMAAHLGGLLGGFVAGLPLVHALTPEAQARTRRRAPLVLAVGLMVLGGLWSRVPRIPDLRGELDAQLTLERRELPGASIVLPEGKEAASRLDYDQGRVAIELPARTGDLTVEWKTGAMSTADELESALIRPITETTTLSIVERTEVAVGEASGVTWRLRGEAPTATRAIATVWPCGKRWFSLMLVSRADASKLEARLRASFACKPDPQRDGQKRGIEVDLDVPPGFGLVQKNPLGLASLDGELFLISSLGRPMTLEKEGQQTLVQKILLAAAAAGGVKDGTFEPMRVERTATGTRKMWRGRGQRDGQDVRLSVALIECSKDAYLAFHLAPVSQPEASAVALLGSARCSPTPTLPRSFAEMAREACARGDRRGCSP